MRIPASRLHRGWISLLVIFAIMAPATPVFGWSSATANVAIIGGAGSQNGDEIATDANGNIFTVGYFTGASDFNPGSDTFALTATGIYDAFVTKFDSSGNFLWARQITTTSTGYSTAYAVTTDLNGNVFLAGAFTETVDLDTGASTQSATSAGDTDVFIIKINASGDFLWGKRIGNSSGNYVFALTTDSTGSIYAGGTFSGIVDFDPGVGYVGFTVAPSNSTDAYLLKLNAAGEYQWTQQFVGSGSGCIYDLKTDSADNLYLFGNFSLNVDLDPTSGTNSVTSAGGEDVFVAKLSSSGSYIWAKSTGGVDYERPNAFAIDAAGNLYGTGYFTGVTDLDPGAGTSIQESSCSNCYSTYVFKWDANGDYLWSYHVHGNSYSNSGQGVAVNQSGEVYLAGYFQYITDFDASSATFTPTAPYNRDFYLLKITQAGSFSWVKTFGSGGNDYADDLVLDSIGRPIAVGFFYQTIDFDNGSGTANFTASGQDTFILKFSVDGLTTFTRDASTISLTLSGGNVAYKGVVKTLTASINTPGKVTFYADGARIPRCSGLQISGSSATCDWKPSVRKNVLLTARLIPASSSYFDSTGSVRLSVASRPLLR